MKKVVFLGSKPIGFFCLKCLIENQTNHNFEIIGVLTNNNKRFGEAYDIPALAQQHNIQVLPSLDELLNLPNVDIIISIQYHQILKKQHIAKAKQIAINLHMAPLPEYRGCNQFSFAIINQDNMFGTTIHQIEEGIDNGAILFEKRFPIPENCYVKTLYDLTYQHSLELFKEHIQSIIQGSYTLTPQYTLLETRKTETHYRKEINDIKKIDWEWDKETIERYFRATAMPGFDPPYTIIGGKKVGLKLLED
ncbi:formyltransferase family protein [Microscilla marina]|uniref:Methionyl-tRNA formyltransferase, putative n=1 Tax=Microscilla marina ATCC 23134 TaxID=313606 RepID=A1ZCI8_MICM2|nr:formyltransferase family protein [Microscilla marina]EAY31990.1 methionyl-tRNA formyltransferase, putative [Microscilla marina ATCC 23134]